MKTPPLRNNQIGDYHGGLALARSFFINIGLIFLAVLLFAEAFPNLLIEQGIPFLAWVAYVPIFVLLRRVNLAASVFWGALYGYAAYGLFNYWLTAFHPLAGFIVNSIYLVFNAALFFLLRLAITLFPRRFYLVQWLIWLAYEYLRTKGFLGYSYGISGYSQWRMIPLIQIAGICGVWGVSALVVFPSAWLGAALGMKNEKLEMKNGRDGFCVQFLCSSVDKLGLFFKKEKISVIVWGCALIAALIYGFAVPSNYDSAPRVNIALIQHNTDPWKGDINQ